MATIKCTEGWATKSWAVGPYTYYDGWVDKGAWQTDFSNNGDSDGYCYRPGNESNYTYGFVFRFKTPAISKFHKSSSLKLTLPIMRTEKLAQTGTLYFKLLTSDPTTATGKDSNGNTRYVFPEAIKITSSNKDAYYNWNLTNYHVNKISVTIETADLKADTTYYVAVGGSSVLHIGYGKVGNYYDADKGSSYEVSEFSPSSGHWAAELTYSTYTDGESPSITTLKDNGDNTVTLKVKQGKSGTNNAISKTTLTYTVDGGSAQTLDITTKSEAEASYTIKVTKKCTIKVTISCKFAYNTTSASKSVSAVFYVAPSNPGKPVISASSYKNNRLTIKQNWTYTWAAAVAGNSDSPIKGYRIRIYKNGTKLTGLTSSTSSNTIGKGSGTLEYVDRESTSCTITFNPVTLGFLPKDTIKVGIYAYTKNGAGTQLWSDTHMISDESTVQNAGVVRVKVNNTWKEGQVWVKVNGVWKEAETVNVKVNGAWKESQ